MKNWILMLCLCLLAACGAPAGGDASPPSGGAGPTQSAGMDSEAPPPGSEEGSKPDPSLAEDEEPTVLTCRIVDGAEDGSLLLAELDGGLYGGTGVYRLDVTENRIPVTLDGQPVLASELLDGMAVKIACNGSVLETFPAQLGEVYSITAETVGGTCFDLCGLYLQVLDDLWQKDSALNENISQIALDLSAAPGGLTESEQAALVWRFGELHGVEAFAATYEQLWEDGAITKNPPEMDGAAYEWKDGCLFSIEHNKDHEDEIYSLPCVFFNAQKWRSSLGAYCFYDCFSGWGQMGTWNGYTIGDEMIA